MTASYEIVIQGFVQGQGVRPAIARLAEQRGWSGTVCNTSIGVRVLLHHVRDTKVTLATQLRSAHPALATARFAIELSDTPHWDGFRVEESETQGSPVAPIPRDVALCDECRAEFQSPENRRHQYGLITCTRCGPRFSIIQAMPFDRGRTTLDRFPLCADCEHEYTSSTDRRGHAQTIGCQKCGPQVWASDRQQRVLAKDDAACQMAARALLHGEIVALRGVGGYQLLVDATNPIAVQELRRRKHRPSKPFAVMCGSLSEAEELGEFEAGSREMLQSATNPIVIVRTRNHPSIAAAVHPHLSDIGLMLPTTAIHQRLLQLVGRPLVCTSGNIEGSPLAIQVDDATTELHAIADLWLHHDRPIAHGLDDSVVRSVAGRTMTIRCARGLAPLPLNLPATGSIMALGGVQKAAMAWSNGRQAALGPHLGDLIDLSTRERWFDSSRHLMKLYQITDPLWACDSHPDAVRSPLMTASSKVVSIWHHHAHIVAGMLEHGWLDRPVIGIAADGQGYGCDGTLWGGDVLWVTASRFERLASVRPFSLPGGELAVLDPNRIVVAIVSQLPDIVPSQISAWLNIDLQHVLALQRVLRARISSSTTSLGRLFDGIARLVLGLDGASYIGEPAARLEAICDPRADGAYRWGIDDAQQPWQLDWRPVLQAILRDQYHHVPPGVIAERFHRSVAECFIDVYRRCPQLPLVVSGGVFQNRRLCELLAERWEASWPPLGLPGMIPPNDGGLAAGQLAIAAATRPSPRDEESRE